MDDKYLTIVEKHTPKEDRLKNAIVVFIAGGIFGVLAEFFYRDFIGIDNRILVITIYMAAFALIVGGTIFIRCLIGDYYKKVGKVLLLTLLSFIVFVGASGLFEFLYEIKF